MRRLHKIIKTSPYRLTRVCSFLFETCTGVIRTDASPLSAFGTALFSLSCSTPALGPVFGRLSINGARKIKAFPSSHGFPEPNADLGFWTSGDYFTRFSERRSLNFKGLAFAGPSQKNITTIVATHTHKKMYNPHDSRYLYVEFSSQSIIGIDK